MNQDLSKLNSEQYETLWILLNDGICPNSDNIDKLWFVCDEDSTNKLFRYNMLLDYGYKFTNNYVLYDFLSLLNYHQSYTNDKNINLNKLYNDTLPYINEYKKNKKNYNFDIIFNYYNIYSKILEYNEVKKYSNLDKIYINNNDIVKSLELQNIENNNINFEYFKNNLNNLNLYNKYNNNSPIPIYKDD